MDYPPAPRGELLCPAPQRDEQWLPQALEHVSIITGYPAAKMEFWWKSELARERGALAAADGFVFTDGTIITQPLCHGVEILRFNDSLQ